MVMIIHTIAEDKGGISVDTCLVDSLPSATEAERLKALEMAAHARHKLVGRQKLGEITGGRKS